MIEPDQPNAEFQGQHPGSGAGATRRFYALTFTQPDAKISIPAGACYVGLRSVEIDTLVEQQPASGQQDPLDVADPAFDAAKATLVAAGGSLVSGPCLGGEALALEANDGSSALGAIEVVLEGAELPESLDTDE